MEESKRLWKNKRRASLYNFQDDVGFIYRKEKEMKLENLREETGTTPSSLSEKLGTSGELPLSDEDIWREARINQDCNLFIQSLRAELQTHVIKGKENEFDTTMDSLLEELKDSGLFKAALEQPEIVPHPMEETASQTILQMKQQIEKYEHELQDWDTLLKRKRENLKEGSVSPPLPDLQQLERHLTEEQLQILREGPHVDYHYTEKKEEEILKINAGIIAEVQAISSEVETICGQLREEQHRYATQLQPQETPRSLVQSLKKTWF